ncbi:hypothetical protein Trydic_g18665 [Trypoxylus dichotomus]
MHLQKVSSFINKPASGWLHSESVISNQGATYTVRYIGCLEVKTSTKLLDFKTRSTVAKVCISKVSEAAGLKTPDKRSKIDRNVLRAIAEEPRMEHAGTNVNMNVSSSKLTLTSLETNQIIASHDMPCISFASDFRACYVLECGGGLAKDVISTIGQAFELRYMQSCKPSNIGLATGFSSVSSESDIDYYNDLPGKVPPDLGLASAAPPPVPPLPTLVTPFTTLPPVQSPNLIDLSADISLESYHHEYVNDIITKERDVFDMQPFMQPQASIIGKIDPAQIAGLQNEIWFHGKINRAEAEKLLISDGDFLVRESPNSEGQYVLSGMQDNMKKHLLLIDPDGVVRTKDRIFNSVSHLIKYHCENILPIISAESALVLRVPVPRKHNI